MSVKINMDRDWDRKLIKGLRAGMIDMTTDIHKKASILAPKDSRNLVKSGKIEPKGAGFVVSFGSLKIPYARKRHFENKKNPQTIGYLKKAGDSVMRGDKEKYFRGKIK